MNFREIEQRPLYTGEPDGTIQRWYLLGWDETLFGVTINRLPKWRDYVRYFHHDDLGKLIFLSRKDAKNSIKKEQK